MFNFLRKKQPKEIDTFSIQQKVNEKYLFENYPLGSRFDYMSIPMRVAEQIKFRRADYLRPIQFPEIKCHYVNKQGEIKSIWLSINDGIEKKPHDKSWFDSRLVATVEDEGSYSVSCDPNHPDYTEL